MSTHSDTLAEQAARGGIRKLVAGALIHDDHGQVLVLRRSPTDDFMAGIEELPSGGVEPGEDLLAGLARELEEETGLPLTGPLHYIDAFDYRSGSGRPTRQFTWSMPLPGTEIRLSAEHTSYRLVSAGKIRDTDVSDETAAIVETWLANRAASPTHS